MNTALFLLSLLIAVVGPLLAISYLKPILIKVLQSLCNAEGGAEFWLRSAYVLGVCGTLLLMLTFGDFREGASVVDTLRRALWLVFAGVFVSVGIISHQVWSQVREVIAPRKAGLPMHASAHQPADWPDTGDRS